jgi:hypothetical protein
MGRIGYLRPAPREGRLGGADDTARESSRAASCGRRRGNFPGTSQATGTGRDKRLWTRKGAATEGDSGTIVWPPTGAAS